MAAIETLVPHYDARELHSTSLRLEPSLALDRALATAAAPDPLVRTLFRLRGLRTDSTIAEAFVVMGFAELARTEAEVVFGASGKPWRPAARIGTFSDPAPGTVRIATDFRSDGDRLTTETRVAAVDDEARRAFARYWRVVGPFSALIRRRWLAAAARTL